MARNGGKVEKQHYFEDWDYRSTFFSVVLVSGCTSYSTNETKTFSDGLMSFDYPGFF